MTFIKVEDINKLIWCIRPTDVIYMKEVLNGSSISLSSKEEIITNLSMDDVLRMIEESEVN